MSPEKKSRLEPKKKQSCKEEGLLKAAEQEQTEAEAGRLFSPEIYHQRFSTIVSKTREGKSATSQRA